jgi:hypothetical protein
VRHILHLDAHDYTHIILTFTQLLCQALLLLQEGVDAVVHLAGEGIASGSGGLLGFLPR